MFSWVLGSIAKLMAAVKLPVYQGTLVLSPSTYSLEGPVEIYRDAMGIPHIFAKKENDVWFGAGFAMAQERLFQMELLRRAAQGRLAEVIPEKLPLDIITRTMGFARMARQDVEVAKQFPEDYQSIMSYVHGVNAYLKSPQFAKPTEAVLLGINIEPWKLEDTCAIARITCWSCAHAWLNKIANLAVADILGKDFIELEDLRNIDDEEHIPFTLPKGTIEANEINWEKVHDIMQAQPPQEQGSNSWAISGKYTKSGKPILASDPHLGIAIPGVWYQHHVQCETFSAHGITFLGAPYVAIGQNDFCSFGITLSFADVFDVYIESFDASNPTKYKHNNEWLEAQVVEEKILVKNGQPHVEKIRITRHGPVITDIIRKMTKTDKVKSPEGDHIVKEFALQGTFANPATNVLVNAFRRINLSKNWQDFKAAAQAFDQMTINFTYADIYGNIGHFMTGKIPIRTKKAQMLSGLPYDGTDDTCDWQGFIPTNENPHCLNPEQGYIISCNHRVVSEDYKYFIGNCFKSGTRAHRIKQMIQECIQKNGHVTVEDCRIMQLDVKEPFYDYVFEALDVLKTVDMEEIAKHPMIKNPSSITTSHVKEVMKQIYEFDGFCTVTSIGATCTFAFQNLFLKRIFSTHVENPRLVEILLGCLNDHIFVVSEYHSHERKLIRNFLSSGSGAKTPEELKEKSLLEKAGGKDVVVYQTLLDVIEHIRNAVAIIPTAYASPQEEVKQYQYGKMHKLTFNHVAGTKIPAYNRGPYPVGGSGHTVNLQAYIPHEKNFRVVANALYRNVTDLSDLSKTVSIMAPGNCENLYSMHYDDGIEPYLKGELKPIRWTKEAVKKDAQNVCFTILPAAVSATTTTTSK